jgi:cell division septation protein DedD
MLEGEISQINLIERLVELWREQFTGAIRFENDGIIKIVYFKSGDILSASTNDRSDSIDEILMRAGKVSREHVKQALAKRKESETLGDALLNLGFITRKELTWARRVQVVGVIRSIAGWTEGSFTIVADYLPKRDEGTLFPLPQVLVELIVTEQDRARFERALDGGNAVFTRTADFDEVWRRLGLNEDAEAIVTEIDGTKTATEVATTSGRDTFNVYKLLHALATLGVLKQSVKLQADPEFSLDDFASAGVADAADVWNDAPEQTQAFDLDDAPAVTDSYVMPSPTVEMPNVAADDDFEARVFDDGPAVPPTPSAWDEADEVPLDLSLETTTPSPKMPVWDSAPPPIHTAWDRETVPAASMAETVIQEPQWGFDEAQLETSRRATEAPPPADPLVAEKRGGRYGLLVALLVIAILAGAGYFGFRWWQKREEAGIEAPQVAQQRPAPAPAQPAATAPQPMTIVPTETAATDTATTAAPVPTPAVITPTAAPAPPPVATATTASAEPPPNQPLPRVTARPQPAQTAQPGRERFDAMASDFAANPNAAFTVQIQILCDPSNLEKVMRAGGENVWFVPQTIRERSCYRVYYGRYKTRAEAQQGLAQVPASIRDQNSAVKALIPKG